MKKHAVVSGLLLLVGVVLTASCSGSVEKSKLGGADAGGDDGGTGVCAPGAQVPCVCAGGAVGVQFCRVDGTGYFACAGCPGSGEDSGTGHHDGGRPGTDGGSPGKDGSQPGKDGAAPGNDGGACPYLPTDTTDHDGDGWSPADGDCNDCNPYVNPGAYDIPGDAVDQDCNGTPDDEPAGCDATLTGPATTTASDGAKAIDLCRTTADGVPIAQKTWGVIAADYVLPDGSASTNANFPLGFGILGPTFGTSNTTQQGMHMLGLSSGTARLPTDPGYQDVSGFDKGYTSGAPPGFPEQIPACGTIVFGAPHDGAALRITVRIPTNAVTMSFDSNLFSYEFPDWICSEFNDTFVVVMSPSPFAEPTTANDNVAFDSIGNTIGVNSPLITVCDTNTLAGDSSGVMKTYPCAEGPSKLLGTGFGIDTTATDPPGDDKNQGSTDWVTTTVSVAALRGQNVTLLFTVWDSSDGVLDTTVLLDNVRWTFMTAPGMLPTPLAPFTVAK